MRKHWKLIVVAAVVVLAPVVIWVATMHLGPQDDVEAYRKLLIAKGEKLEIKEVLPPVVLPEQNGADLVKEAFGLLTADGNDYRNWPPAMRMIEPGKAIVCFEQADARDYSFTNSWSNEMEVVEAERPATELLKQAMNYPIIDFQLDYSKAPDLPLPYLAPLKRSAMRLSAEAICDLHNGDAASATTNICALLALVNAYQDERLLISQLVRMAMAQIAVGPSWELLQSSNLNEADLAMLQKSWERLEFIRATENAFLMERASSESTVKKMRASDEYFNHIINTYEPGGSSTTFWDSAKFAGSKFMWHVSWTYSDEFHMLQNNQIILDTLRTIETNQFFDPACSNMLSKLEGLETTNKPNNWVTKLDVPDFRGIFSDDGSTLGSVVERVMAAEAAKRMVITAITLKRYQLKHGNYPMNLDLLAPEFLPAVPLDPVDGQPLRYRRNSNGTYLLYSVGPNGIDDGGNPAHKAGSTYPGFSWLNQDALDWVWPQPATVAEVEYYYEHPPK